MTGLDELKQTLRCSIELHEQLRDLLQDECSQIETNLIDSLPGRFSKKMMIEKDIADTNRAVSDLFEHYYYDAFGIDRQSRLEIGTLVKRLRESIHDTVSTIGETVEAVKRSKQDIIDNIRNIDNNKVAVFAYSKSKFV